MKTPRFSLQKILDLKELLVESHAVELEKSRQELNQQQSQLRNMQSNKAQTLAASGNVQKDGSVLSPVQLQYSRDYVIQLSERIKDQEKSVDEQSHQVLDKREALVKANQEKKALELLREKHLSEFKKELRKKEQADESEIALRLRRNRLSELD